MTRVVNVNALAGDWLADRPPETIEADGLILGRVGLDDVAALVAAINQSLDHLGPWMAWAQEPASTASMVEFVAGADAAWTLGTEFQYVIRRESPGAIAGACGLHARRGPGVLEIGYWVHVDHVGAGIATRAADALTRAAFALRGVETVEISCVATNVRSAAVPQKLGYRLVETVPHSASGAAHVVWAIDRS
jgi:RimJ/RimL family protein N-acetyltransferase